MSITGRAIYWVCCVVFWVLLCFSSSGQKETPSPESVLSACQAGDSTAYNLAKDQLRLTQASNNKELQAKWLMCIGVFDLFKSSYPLAIESFTSALEIRTSIKDSSGIASAENNLGLVYYRVGNRQKAIDHFSRAITLRKQLNDPAGMAASLVNIANLYSEVGQKERALQTTSEALILYKKLDNKYAIAGCLSNIGSLYDELNQKSKAKEAFEESISIRKALSDDQGLAETYGNLAELAEGEKNYSQAVNYNLKALEIAKALAIDQTVTQTYINLSKLFLKQNNVQVAGFYLGEAQKLAQNIESDKLIAQLLELAIEIEKAKGNFKQAISYLESLGKLQEKIRQEADLSKILELENQYLVAAKEAEISTLQAEAALKELKIKEQDERAKAERLLTYLLIVIVFSTAFFAIFFFRNARKERLAKETQVQLAKEIELKNIALTEANIELKAQKLIIEDKQKLILDNLDYAQKVVSHLQADWNRVGQYFQNLQYFILPKDVIGGDFIFFLEYKEVGYVIFGDCVGHGVSGAMMTVITQMLAQEIIHVHASPEVGFLLNVLDQELRKVNLSQKEMTSPTGIVEITVLRRELNKPEITFSGAGLAVYLVSKNGVKEVPSRKYALGNTLGLNLEFETLTLNPSEVELALWFTDGYFDQFAEIDGKRMMRRNLLAHITHLQQTSSEAFALEGKDLLYSIFQQHKGKLEQIDDASALLLTI